MTDKEIFENWFDNIRPKLKETLTYKFGVYIDYIEFAKHYHKVKSRELLLDFADYSESDKKSQTTDECVDNYLDNLKSQTKP